jgi:Fe-S cluster assembly protein SufD
MKVELLKTQKTMVLTPKSDTQYVLVPEGEMSIDLIMEKEGISTEFLVLYILRDSDQVNLSTQVLHKVPNTACLVRVKGVLWDKARSDYMGKIVIDKGAQQTTSYLEDDVLSVGEKSRNHSQPILEIEADDVKASHGATTGRIDKDQIYYLMTRGLSEEEAQEMVIDGFFESLLVRIKDDKVRSKVRRELYV